MSSVYEADSPVPVGHRRFVFPPIGVLDFLAMQTHFEDVARELRLIEVGGHLGEDIPIHVSTLTEALARGRTAMRNEARWQAMNALQDGSEAFALEIILPDPPEPGLRAMLHLFDETDRCSERGLLLTPKAPAGARRVLEVLLDHVRRERA